MQDDDPVLCCVLGVCCGLAEQRKAVKKLAVKFQVADEEAFCDWWCDHINTTRILKAIEDRLGR